jgi:hypothetical protein
MNKSLINLGYLLVISGLAVTIPVIVLALLHVTGHTVSSLWEGRLLTFSAVGFAVVSTGGGAFIGHTLVTRDKHRLFLSAAWLTQIMGLIFIGSTYLLMLSSGSSLNDILPELWQRSAYFIVVVATPEIGVVAGLVCVADHIRVNVEVAELREELVKISIERNKAEMELKAIAKKIEEEIERRVSESLSDAAQRYRERFNVGDADDPSR